MANENDKDLEGFDEESFFDEEESSFDSEEADGNHNATSDATHDDFHDDSESHEMSANANKPKSILLPLAVGAVVVGLAGFKLYTLLMPSAPPPAHTETIPTFQQKAPTGIPAEQSKAVPQAQNAPTPPQPNFHSQNGTGQQPASNEALNAIFEKGHTPEAQQKNPQINPSTPQQPQTNIAPQSQTPVIPKAAPQQPQGSAMQQPGGMQPSTLQPQNMQAQMPDAGQQGMQNPGIDLTPPDDTARIEALSKMEANLSHQVDSLSSAIGKMSETLSRLDQNLQSITRDVNQLKDSNQKSETERHQLQDAMKKTQDTTKTLQQTVENMAPLPPIANKDKSATTVATENTADAGSAARSNTDQDYVVEALIPGRAWLRSSEGITITVTEGDALGRYGKVIAIDAENGALVTSSGITLRY